MLTQTCLANSVFFLLFTRDFNLLVWSTSLWFSFLMRKEEFSIFTRMLWCSSFRLAVFDLSLTEILP